MVDLLKNWNVHMQDYITRIEQTFRIQINLKSMAANTVKQFALYVYQYSPGVLAQTVTFFFQGFLMVIVVFFLFVEGKGLYNEIVVLSPMKTSHENALAREMKNMIYAVVYGSFVTALVQGFLAGIAFYFLGIQGYLVWGSLTFLFSFIPILGAGSVWVPAAVILFLLGEVKSAVFLTFYGALVISGIDNVLKPLLMRGKNKLHPLLLFLSIMGGLLFAGPIGILLGPVTLAVFLAALKIYKQDYFVPEKG
jgi:predicted PurR-regulated permease PerM